MRQRANSWLRLIEGRGMRLLKGRVIRVKDPE